MADWTGVDVDEGSTQDERWLDVIGFEGLYQVSDLGRVRSVDRILKCGNHERRHRGCILKQGWAGRSPGHRKVSLGSGVTRYVHQLVLEAFKGPRPDGMEGCHKNGDTNDNSHGNLKWGTTSENRFDSVRHGTHNKTRRRACPLGHLLRSPNLRNDPSGNGTRRCLACLYAYNFVKQAAVHGLQIDKRAEADRQYKMIMAGDKKPSDRKIIRLSGSEELQIVRLLSEGMLQGELATLYGVNQSRISRIKKKFANREVA